MVIGLVVDHGAGVLAMGTAVNPMPTIGGVGQRLGARALELVFFGIVLSFAVWVALSVQQNAQEGQQRWEKDKQAHSALTENVKNLPLTAVWCRRDAEFIRQSFTTSAMGRCPLEGGAWLGLWLINSTEDVAWSVAQQQHIVSINLQLLVSRLQLTRMLLTSSSRGMLLHPY